MVWASFLPTQIIMCANVVVVFFFQIVCLLCVISQYQEYSDSRGRASDQPGAAQVGLRVLSGAIKKYCLFQSLSNLGLQFARVTGILEAW